MLELDVYKYSFNSILAQAAPSVTTTWCFSDLSSVTATCSSVLLLDVTELFLHVLHLLY